MTDEELIEWLRKPYGDAMMERAADRIEALLNLNEALVELMDDRDAKLTKVVEALPRWILAMGDWDRGGEQAIEEMTATLAEIKGESHD